MGFDLTIHLNVRIDPETGMACKRQFMASEYTVPEKFREYLIQRGACFHSYIKKYSEDVNITDVERFLEDYPEWLQVKEDFGGEDYQWEEEDHDGFKEALKWMSSGKNTGVFLIRWSY